MKKLQKFFLSDIPKDDYNFLNRQKVLLVLDLVGFILTLVQLLINISFQKEIASTGRTIVLPLLMSLTFFGNIFIIKYAKGKYLAGNILVITLLSIHVSFLAYYAPNAKFTYYFSGYYHALLFYALTTVVGNKKILFLNTLILLVGYNIAYYRGIPGIEPELIKYSKIAYINYQVVVIAIGIILYSGKWIAEKAFANLIVSEKKANSYAITLQKLFEQVKNVVESLVEISEQLNNQTSTISLASNQQASNIEEITSTIEENTMSLSETANRTQETDKFATQVKHFVKQNLINFEETVQSIEKISDSSVKIDDIASKTEILAINAAIEARRGKSNEGSGFSVISTEIRSLAEKTKETAEYIQLLVNTSTEFSKNSEKKILEIYHLISELDERIAGIATAAEEQKISLVQISKSISEINNSSQDNSATAENLVQISSLLNKNIVSLQKLLS